MKTTERIHREHSLALEKIQTLEKDLSDVLQHATRKETSRLTEDFLDFFESALIPHFKVESVAVFPVVRGISKESDELIKSLVAEHASIAKKFHMLRDSFHSETEQDEILLDLLKELATHALKEEKKLMPLFSSMNKQQMKKIDDMALKSRYGYG